MVSWCAGAILSDMARLTITLSDERHRRLKMQAAYQGTTIGHLIEEGLEAKEELARQTLLALLDKAQTNAAGVSPQLSEDELMELAVAETRAVRREMLEERRAATHHH